MVAMESREEGGGGRRVLKLNQNSSFWLDWNAGGRWPIEIPEQKFFQLKCDTMFTQKNG